MGTDKDTDELTDITGGGMLLNEQLLDLEDVDALLEQVMKEAEEQKKERESEPIADNEFAQMDSLLEQASNGVPQDEEILSMLQALEDEEKNEIADKVSDELKPMQTEEISSDNESLPEEEVELLAQPKEKKPFFLKALIDKILSSKKEKKAQIDEEVQQSISQEEPANTQEVFSQEENQEPVKEKKKKKKKSKEKNASKSGEIQDNEMIAAEMEAEDKKNAAKKKKEKKPKKVKAKKNVAREEKEQVKEKSYISGKGIAATLIVCLTLALALMVVSYTLPTYLSLHKARKAFYAQNYKEALHRLHGLDLNDSDEILYKKALILNELDLYYEQYQIYKGRGMRKDALNALFDGYKACCKKKVVAQQFGVEEELELFEQKNINALKEECGVTEDEIVLICDMKKLEYTISLQNLADNKAYDAVTTDTLLSDDKGNELFDETKPEGEYEMLPDLLPEELELQDKLKDKSDEENEKDSDTELFQGVVKDGAILFE